MKTRIKKVCKIVFGTDSDIIAKLSITSFVSAMIFLLITVFYPNNPNELNFFTYSSAFCFVVWLTLTKGVESAQKFFWDILRISVFFALLIFSLNNCLHLNSHSNCFVFGVLNCIVLFICIFYFVSIISNIYYFVIRLFGKIKSKIYNDAAPATTKWKALIENITAFLVTIGGLTLALKTILDTIFQLKGYFQI